MSTWDVALEPGRAASGSAEWLRAARRAKLLAWASLGWMTIEGVVYRIAEQPYDAKHAREGSRIRTFPTYEA